MSEDFGRLATEGIESNSHDVGRWRSGERARLQVARLLLNAEERAAKAYALSHHLDELLAAKFGDLAGRCISAYWPIKAELDLRPWMQALHERGAIVALPIVEIVKQPLLFRRWAPGMLMERGIWNILVPPSTSAVVVPQICLAPLVGWDASGYRLGYGGGYFDRTLATLKPGPYAIGVGVQLSQIESIQPQQHDIPLNAIVTELGVQFKNGLSTR